MDPLSLSYSIFNLIKNHFHAPYFTFFLLKSYKPIQQQQSSSLNWKKKMGRDWSWLGGGKKKSSSKSKNEDTKTTPSPPSLAGNTTTAAGCMSAVFNIFDFNHLQFPINHHHLHLPKGTIFLFYFSLFQTLHTL